MADMRLIDANAAYRKAYEKLHYRAELEDYEFDAIVNFLELCPTIDPETLQPVGRRKMRGDKSDNM